MKTRPFQKTGATSTNCSVALVRCRRHSSRPLFASSANASESVVAVDAAVAEREPVRPVVAEPVAPLPAQRAASRGRARRRCCADPGRRRCRRRRSASTRRCRSSCAARGTGSASARAGARRCRSRSSRRRLRACPRDRAFGSGQSPSPRWPPHPAARHTRSPPPHVTIRARFEATGRCYPNQRVVGRQRASMRLWVFGVAVLAGSTRRAGGAWGRRAAPRGRTRRSPRSSCRSASP